jgi:hypothetical protein
MFCVCRRQIMQAFTCTMKRQYRIDGNTELGLSNAIIYSQSRSL